MFSSNQLHTCKYTKKRLKLVRVRKSCSTWDQCVFLSASALNAGHVLLLVFRQVELFQCSKFTDEGLVLTLKYCYPVLETANVLFLFPTTFPSCLSVGQQQLCIICTCYMQCKWGCFHCELVKESVCVRVHASEWMNERLWMKMWAVKERLCVCNSFLL